MLEARSDKWEALGTLSAGAAHELATPLATIAIVTKELENALSSGEFENGDRDEMRSDVATVRTAVMRCRKILDRMSIDAGHATLERFEVVAAGDLIEQTLEESPDGRSRVQIRMSPNARVQCVEIPPHSVKQALRAVIQNALDASPTPVDIRLDTEADQLRIEITDRGPGMDIDTLRRADEPFFTTKEAGCGMGLGRFIARTVFERIGGSFATQSVVGEGTIVTVTIPHCGCSPLDQPLGTKGSND